ncbi:MAG TPA: hypothetical protein PLF40_21730 [Kofleriaceae bacterium]|nr:hypothetical protein [Kofleriaceae bacterium]
MLLAVSCGEAATPGGGTPDAGGVTNPSAPRFLSFGTNVTRLTEYETISFTAVLTDPDGIDDLIGGSLTSPDGTIQYGAFASPGQEGSYSIRLTWDAINQVEDITFATKERREFRAEFFDAAGHSAERLISIELSCNDRYACDGNCASICGAGLEQRVSCKAACSQKDMDCFAGDTDRRAFYRLGGSQSFRMLATCDTVPTATYDGLPFYVVECECTPRD